MKFTNKKVLVVGAGKSGIAAVKLLSLCKAEIILFDASDKVTKEEIRSRLANDFDGEIVLKTLSETDKKGLDYVILSPGVPTDLDFINELRDRKVPVIGEIELGYYFHHGKMAAITGTNGKTTTTTLVGEIMKTYFDSVFVAGNIGIPYTDIVTQTTDDSVTVAEMSSFQLETCQTFRPDVSAILNITPDHLNRHHTMEAYIDAKFRIAMNQTGKDTCVLNYEDLVLREKAKEIKAKILWFSSRQELQEGLFLKDDKIIIRKDGCDTLLCHTEELKIFGRHNYENVMAAAGIALSFHVPVSDIHKALVAFKGVEHRIEFVAVKNGVSYYNDSKGTNPDASIQAIRAMKTKTLLIAGGYDKGNEYDEWIEAFDGKVSWLVLLGQTREKIKEAALSHGISNIVLVDSLKEAVDFCEAHANEGESVLLSPCCASWGMFKNYEQRGDLFKQYVHEIKEN